MQSEILRKVALSLFSVPPLLLRKTRRRMGQTGDQYIYKNITHLHFEIVKVLYEEHTMRVAEIGKRLHIAKAQMTQLVNKLADLELVARQTDPSDRRAINIILTKDGKKFIKKRESNLIASLQIMLDDLSEHELNELYNALNKIEQVLNKL